MRAGFAVKSGTEASVSPRYQRGTTLIELMVALAVFLVIGGAAFSLFNRQQSATTTLQGQVGLSLALRNTTSQLQLDLSNSGNGYFQGVNIPTWPVGVTIQNHFVPPGSSCYNSTTGTYTSTCFDQINIITADPVLYPAVSATDATGGTGSTNCSSTYTGSTGSLTTVYALPATGLTAAATAAKFAAGDQLIFLTGNGKYMTTAVLSANGSPLGSGKGVALSVYQTNSDGSNPLAADPLDITACDGNSPCPPPPPVTTPATPPSVNFGTNYCAGDWIIKLSPIQYYVDTTTNPSNPQLIRKQNGVASVVMDQIIGFKVGAATWDSNLTSGYSTPYYNYDSSTYCIGGTGTGCTGGTPSAWNFSLIRSIRVSIIARTTPNINKQDTFLNTFDGGAYQVQGAAIVVNPRNLSMSDDQTLP
jgi:prepilin-type N-terminal cleavage/methylation domain-containing protein